MFGACRIFAGISGSPGSVHALRQLWEDHARQRLWDTFDRAFGGLPADVITRPVVLRGKPGTVLTGLARQDGDLLVIGASRRAPRPLPVGPVSRYCLAHATCPVLAIPPPTWPSMQAMAYAAGPTATACTWTPPW